MLQDATVLFNVSLTNLVHYLNIFLLTSC
uniref:Uncharacterized protein n=1 Tax=Arundo donax TaxID=35708 RepID=A0A0A9AHQ6_ARUDO